METLRRITKSNVALNIIRAVCLAVVILCSVFYVGEYTRYTAPWKVILMDGAFLIALNVPILLIYMLRKPDFKVKGLLIATLCSIAVTATVFFLVNIIVNKTVDNTFSCYAGLAIIWLISAVTVFLQKPLSKMNFKKILIVSGALSMAFILTFTATVLGLVVSTRVSKGVVPTADDLQWLKDNGKVYSRVVVFGVDGAGDYFSKTETPNFDRIFADGSVTHTAMSQFPTVSAQNWGSMMHGVRCSKHKLTNGIASEKDYTDTEYPSFFKVYAERHPSAVMCSVVNWGAINKGIIEPDIPGMTKIYAGNVYDGNEGSYGVDKEVAKQVVGFIQTNDPDIMYMQFDSVDGAGHDYGYGSDEFALACRRIDQCIGMIYDAYLAKGWLQDTLFVFIADHGHELTGGHGSNNKTVRYVTCAVAGGLGNVIKGTPGRVVTQDIAAIVTYALGDTLYESWEARVPYNIFTTLA